MMGVCTSSEPESCAKSSVPGWTAVGHWDSGCGRSCRLLAQLFLNDETGSFYTQC